MIDHSLRRSSLLEDEMVPYVTLPVREAAEHCLSFFDPESVEARSCAPIGVFDSGAGGLTILSALRQELPNEHYIYLGDTAHCPYGVRTEAEIMERLFALLT